jgi:hypothetical protein
MTERLYYLNPYRLGFEARIVERTYLPYDMNDLLKKACQVVGGGEGG